MKNQIINLINRHHFSGDQQQLEGFLLTKMRMKRSVISKNISEMIKSGLLEKTKNGKLFVSNKNLLKGKIIGHDKGFAFCEVKDKEDFFIPPTALNGALNGDIVLIKPTKASDRSTEAEVVKIVEHANTTLVGTYYECGNGGFVKPDNSRINKEIFIKPKDSLECCNGDKVVIKLKFSKNPNEISAQVIEILGKSDDLKTLEMAIIRDHKLYEEFPKDVLDECDEIPDEIDKSELVNRLDLREEVIFTIDGEDARDLDDAVSLKVENGIYKLGVHIADVTHYVKQDSEIDKEAFLRATSVYFPNMVLPMLPRKLSNGICSLNGGVERLTLSVFMDIDKNGNVISHSIHESVIKSVKRLTYTQVYSILQGEDTYLNELGFLKDTFFQMLELSKILEKKRSDNGALDFDLPENYIEIDENLKITAVKKRERNDAHKLIESFMVICNQVVAQEFYEKQIPFVYRVHEKPVLEKLEDVKTFMEGLGYNVPQLPKVISPKYYQMLISAVSNDEDVKYTVNKVILRSLQKAKYYDECLGHFGLGLTYYCHFTSPIRRYPDLAIHRIIKENLKHSITGKRLSELNDFVLETADRSSLMEKNADDAERDVDDLLKCIYMRDKIGEEFDGIISGVTNFGIFIELENTVEGMVRIENLPKDGYLFFEKSLMLKGSHHAYKLGQKVKVKVENSNIYDRKIDFSLIEK